MTNIEAISVLKKEIWSNNLLSKLQDEYQNILDENTEALELAIKALEAQTEINIYDKEETYHGCTVQVLTNTVTGQTSVGWWQE